MRIQKENHFGLGLNKYKKSNIIEVVIGYELLTAKVQVIWTQNGPINQTPSIGCSIKWRNCI
jgi:hypothetical protein